MNRSDSIKNIAVALCKFQSECPAPKKTAQNPHFKSSYSPLDEIISTTKPHLANNELTVFQSTTADGEKIGVTTLVMHSSGEFIESDVLWLPMGKANAQGGGSSITYARRYSYCAALNIAAEEDDDGNGASEAPKASENQLNFINNLLTKKATDKFPKDKCYAYLKEQMKTSKDMENWTPTEASKAIAILQGKENKGA